MNAHIKQSLWLLLIINIFSIKAGEEPKHSTEEPKFSTTIKRDHGIETVCLTDENGKNGGMITYIADYANNSHSYRKRKISFKAVAQIMSDSDDITYKNYLEFRNSYHLCKGVPCDCKTQTFLHPLIRAGKQPYQDGNGGLLNPILRRYCVKADEIIHGDRKGARIEVSGIVAADGIAEYEFDKEYYGQPYGLYVYEMSLLEAIILGALKERAVDRQLADYDEAGFAYYADHPTINKHFNTFIECIKKEYTSKINIHDTGKRSVEHEGLIQRHVPHDGYWRNKFERAGVAKCSSSSSRISQELNELEIKVEAT